MENYIEITTAEELEKFLYETVAFHDSMVKELQMINRGYVKKDKSMVTSHRFDTRILIQSQWNPIAFELVCIDTQHLSAIDPREYMGCSGKFIESPEKLIELSLDDDFIVQCKKLFYKLCPEYFGNYEHLGSQIPTDEMQQGISLGSNWWQCSNCSEAWQVDEGRKYSTCPKCNGVAKLAV